MRAPPAIDVPLSQGGPWHRAGAGLAAASAALVAGWLAWHHGLTATPALALPGLALASAVLAAAARRPPRGRPARLHWTGTGWQLRLPGEAAPRALHGLAVRLDLGGGLLLRGREAAGASRWIAVQRRQAGAAWSGLRMALAHGERP